MSKHNTRKNHQKKSKKQIKRHIKLSKKNRSKKSHRGGSLLSSSLNAAKQALLPFVMYKAQKSMEKRVFSRKNKK